MDYDLELKRVIETIQKQNVRRVCIQLPDGLKPKASFIKDALESIAHVEVVIWLGSCFGACDIPPGLESLGVDLLIQWGHNDEFVMGQR